MNAISARGGRELTVARAAAAAAGRWEQLAPTLGDWGCADLTSDAVFGDVDAAVEDV